MKIKSTIASATTALVAGLMIGCGGETTQTVRGPEGKELTVSYPKKLNIEPGSTSVLKLQVERKGVKGPVSVDFDALPDGVTVVESSRTIPDVVSSATFTLKADPTAKPVDSHVMKVSASAEGVNAGPFNIQLAVAKNGVDWREQREDFQNAMNKKLEEVDGMMTKLQAKAKEATGDAKVEMEKQWNELKKRRDELGERMKKFSADSGEAWSEFSKGVHNAYDELANATKKALDKYDN